MFAKHKSSVWTQTYQIIFLFRNRGLFAHVVATVGHTLELPFSYVFIPVNILFYHLLQKPDNDKWNLAHLIQHFVIDYIVTA